MPDNLKRKRLFEGQNPGFKHMVSAACLLIDTGNRCHDVLKGKFEKSTCLFNYVGQDI